MSTETGSQLTAPRWLSKRLLLSAAVMLGLLVSIGLFAFGLRKSADKYPFQQQLIIVEIQQLELSTLIAQPDTTAAALSMLRLDVGNRLLLNGGLPGPLMPELTSEVNPLPANARFATINHNLNDLQEDLIVLQRSAAIDRTLLIGLSTQLDNLYKDLSTKLRTEEQLSIQEAQNQRVQLLVASILALLGVIVLLFARLNNSDSAVIHPQPEQQPAQVDHTPREPAIDLRTPTVDQEPKTRSIRSSKTMPTTELLRPLVALSDYRIHGLILPSNTEGSATQRIQIAEEIWRSLDQRNLSIPIIVGIDELRAEKRLDLPDQSAYSSQIEIGLSAPGSAAHLERALDQVKAEGWRTRVLGMTLPLAESLDFRRWPLEAAHIDPELVQPPGPSDDVAAIGRTFAGLGIPVVADGLNDSALISTLVRSGVSYGSGHALAEPVSARDVVDWAQDTLSRPNPDRR